MPSYGSPVCCAPVVRPFVCVPAIVLCQFCVPSAYVAPTSTTLPPLASAACAPAASGVYCAARMRRLGVRLYKSVDQG